MSLTNTDGLGYLGMKELEQKMRGRNRHVSMSLTRVVKDPGYLTQNDTSSVKFAYILTVWQQKCIIHTYSIKKNVLNHKCDGFLMVVMFSIFLEYLHLTPHHNTTREEKKSRKKNLYI